jgi:hypothetical protein
MGFYAYMWLREDGTPYYVGKGSGSRAFWRHRKRFNPPPKDRIVLIPCETEAEAFAQEIVLIDIYGRKDDGTGILRNLTDGGENPPRAKKGRKFSLEARQRMCKPRSHRWSLSSETRRHQSAAAVLRESKKKELRSQGVLLPSNLGKHWTLSEETKAKMRNRVFTAETRAKLCASQQARRRREQEVI